ncbi:hypothetical protein AYI69_g9026 [Smittium culicis]|uniref:Uncharacterized protein n=1 Tax=Smittium culicis TaxID=133412 RepID=A0A1R1XFE8_9FUNG|nr:hypothetical protein AYI69_g9026 [Smittium culicis]
MSSESSESITSSSCPSTSTFPLMSLNSSVTPKYYGNNVVQIPCCGSDFQIEFATSSQADLYVAFVDNDGFPTSKLILESQLGVVSGRNSLRTGRYSSPVKREISKRQAAFTQVYAKYQYINGVLFVYKNGVFVISTTVVGIPIKKLYFAPLQYMASVFDGLITCL